MRFALLCTLPLALAACQQGEKKAAAGGAAQGEILPASASDAMLPLDTVRSQPPLAPTEVASGKPGKGGKSGQSAGGSDGTSEEDSDATPAVTPSLAAEGVQ